MDAIRRMLDGITARLGGDRSLAAISRSSDVALAIVIIGILVTLTILILLLNLKFFHLHLTRKRFLLINEIGYGNN